jgi:hypothetical protein
MVRLVGRHGRWSCWWVLGVVMSRGGVMGRGGSRWRRRGGRPRREFHFQGGGELLHGILFVVGIPLRAPEQQVLVIHLS